ncbi:hypothetical protein ACFYVL_18655 [Streptomyces sp. NPDC004111]|uniref:hypothetical protein n=1 Tax=Streptomyces sp. NPDC004111 TaxID=3364690 RepID=UPI0036B935F4
MHTRTLRVAGIGLAASSLLLATACGGAADAEEKSAAKKTPARTATATPTPKPAAPLTQRQAESALLTVQDMPTGWSKDNEMSSSDAGPGEFSAGRADKKQCQFLLDGVVGSEKGPKPQNTGLIAFTKSQEGPFLLNGVTAYAEAEATALIKARPVPETCRTFRAELEGDKVTVNFEDLSVPKAGQDSQGVRLKLESEDPEMPVLQYDVANARVGGAIVTVMEISFTKADVQAFSESFTKAVAKAEKITKAGPGGRNV